MTERLVRIVTVLWMAGATEAGFAGEKLTTTGIVEPIRDATLSATVAGTISVMAKKEGESVRQGETILELDSQMEKLEVARRKLIAESKVEVEAASNQVETLRLDLEGTRKIYKATQSVSKDDLLKKELEFKLAKAELDKLLIAEQREEIEAKMADVQLALRSIKAPFDGVITKVNPEVGEYCNPQQPLVRIVDIRQCRFVTHVDAKVPWQLQSGATVNLLIDGPQGALRRQGKVTYVSPVADPSSGLKEVKVLVDNADGRISPGVTGTMSLASEKEGK